MPGYCRSHPSPGPNLTSTYCCCCIYPDCKELALEAFATLRGLGHEPLALEVELDQASHGARRAPSSRNAAAFVHGGRFHSFLRLGLGVDSILIMLLSKVSGFFAWNSLVLFFL